ncbi:MAG: hypothetical protein VSS75_017740 [Candidatus Parabeggiatoa sp.]|nr:hypothetical protein [Candidatus Parabeggiatoa sp.]
MKTLGIEAVDFTDSYLLGWKKVHDSVVLFLELLLTEEHPQFQPFDEEQEYGCYKLGSFIFNPVTQLQGLPQSEIKPRWNETLKEYEAITEINDIFFENEYVQIETDENLITIYCFEAELIIASIGWVVPIDVPKPIPHRFPISPPQTIRATVVS